jgi:membrane protease YdiL (CAAX protease family)
LNDILIQGGICVGIGTILLIILISILLIFQVEINKHGTEILLSFCYILIAPFFEEVIFRAPLLFFNSLSIQAIITSIIVSCYFGFIHRNNKEKWNKKLNKDIKVSLFSKSFTVCITGFLGFNLSIITIKTQSLYYPVIIHFVYNLTIIIIAAIISTYKVRKQIE